MTAIPIIPSILGPYPGKDELSKADGRYNDITSSLDSQAAKVKELALAISLSDTTSTNQILTKPSSAQIEMTQLDKNIKKLSKFLPASELLQFSPGKMNLSQLDLIFNTIAFSFAFDPAVQKIIKEEKGDTFEFYTPALQKTSITEAARVCNRVLEAILPKIDQVYDKNLTILWKELLKHIKTDLNMKDYTPDQIRTWMNDTANRRVLNSILILDLKKEPLTILPPEVNLLPKLFRIELSDTKLFDYPHALDAHPNLGQLQIHVDQEHFARFGANIDFS